MPLEIVRNDLIKMHVDGIVNPTNPHMYGTEGLDGLIHKTAGQALRTETMTLGLCSVGQVKLSRAYNMPAKYIIHTVGPIWKDGNHGEEALLISCYKKALELAFHEGFESLAMPLIASGSFGYPKDKVLNIAIATIGEFLLKHDMMVYLVVYDKKSFELSEKLFKSISTYIDDHYVEEKIVYRSTNKEYLEDPWLSSESSSVFQSNEVSNKVSSLSSERKIKKRKLEDLINHLEETFSEMLLRFIREREIYEAEVYKKANIDRKHFSKIRNNKDYRPSKETVLAFAIALELSLDESKDLLNTAGFAFSSSSRFDLIIQFFIEERDYDIFKINEALYTFDEKTLGV